MPWYVDYYLGRDTRFRQSVNFRRVSTPGVASFHASNRANVSDVANTPTGRYRIIQIRVDYFSKDSSSLRFLETNVLNLLSISCIAPLFPSPTVCSIYRRQASSGRSIAEQAWINGVSPAVCPVSEVFLNGLLKLSAADPRGIHKFHGGESLPRAGDLFSPLLLLGVVASVNDIAVSSHFWKRGGM